MRHFAFFITSILVAASCALAPRTSAAETASQTTHALLRVPVEANAATCAKSLPTIKAAMSLTRPRTSNEQQWIHFAYDCLDKGEMLGIKWWAEGHFSFGQRDMVWNSLSPTPVPDNVNEGTCSFAYSAFYNDLIPLSRTRTRLELQWVRFYYDCLGYYSSSSAMRASGNESPLPARGKSLLPPVPDEMNGYTCELASSIVATLGRPDDRRQSEDVWVRFYYEACKGEPWQGIGMGLTS